MTSMFVPEPVMSLAVTPKKSKKGGGAEIDNFSKVGKIGVVEWLRPPPDRHEHSNGFTPRFLRRFPHTRLEVTDLQVRYISLTVDIRNSLQYRFGLDNVFNLFTVYHMMKLTVTSPDKFFP